MAKTPTEKTNPKLILIKGPRRRVELSGPWGRCWTLVPDDLVYHYTFRVLGKTLQICIASKPTKKDIRLSAQFIRNCVQDGVYKWVKATPEHEAAYLDLKARHDVFCRAVANDKARKSLAYHEKILKQQQKELRAAERNFELSKQHQLKTQSRETFKSVLI